MIPRPSWFFDAFEHPVTVWHREPILRELVDRLDEQNLDLNRGQECSHCHSLNLTTEGRTVSPLDDPKIICEECGHEFMLREFFKNSATPNVKNKA